MISLIMRCLVIALVNPSVLKARIEAVSLLYELRGIVR